MVALPPILLVLDVSALSGATPREWLEFSRVGSCIVPQVVYDEMRFLFDRAPDPDLENIARAFNRFYPSSGWQISEVNSHHLALKSSTEQAMTRRSRLSLAVGRCAYGLAQTTSNSLVVLVSRDRALLQRLYEIKAHNLCGITTESLLQWSRSGQRPIPVSQKLQQMRLAKSGLSPTSPTTTPSRQGDASRKKSRKASRQSQHSEKPVSMQESAGVPTWFPDFIALLLALLALAIAGFIGWALFSNTGLREFFMPTETPEQAG